MAAWELRVADYRVATFDDMTVLDFRQLFADRDFEPGMMQLEVRIEGGGLAEASGAGGAGGTRGRGGKEVDSHPSSRPPRAAPLGTPSA